MYKASLPTPTVPTVAIGETADTTNVRLLAKDGSYVSPTDKISDDTSNGNSGGDVLRWNINLSIVDTAPEAIFIVDMPSTGYYCVWISYKNGDADFQLNTSDLKTYTNATFGRLANHSDYSFALATNYNGTPKRFNITSTGNKKFYFRTEKGVRVDGIYIGKTSDGTSTGTCNATPSLPSGVAPLVPDYTINSYNAITVNGTLSEDEWANSPNVSFASNPTNNAITKFSLLWNDGANRVCGAVQVTDQVTDQGTLRTDSTWYSSDHIEVVLSPGTLKTPTDAETVKYAINADCLGTTPQISTYLWSGTGFLSTPDATLTASMSASCAYAAGVYTIEWCGNIPWNPAADDGINFQADMTDSDTLGPTNAIAFGTSVNNPQQWGTAQFVAAPPPSPPPDTTPPSCGTPRVDNITQTSLTFVVPSCTDYNGASPTTSRIDSKFYWGPTASYELAPSGQVGSSVSAGGSPSLTVTGLSCGTHYHWKAVLTDTLGNPTDTGDKETDTTACSNYYISPTGAGTKDCSSEGNACETFAKIKTAMLNSQRQNIILLDGTYTAATTGLPDINCSGSTPWPNGISTAAITIKAKNERQALLHSTGSAQAAFHIANCSYWNVEGLHGTEDDNASGGGYSIFQGDNIHNVTFKRLLADHTNRCANVYGILIEATSTNTRIEECEVYYYHRWSIGSFGDANGGQNHNIQIRNYSNSRNYVSQPQAPVNCAKPAQDIYTGGGDFGEAFYNGYQETIIDGITERAQNAGVGSPGYRSNALYGYITINSGNGANFAWDSPNYYHSNPVNAQIVKDFISVGSGDGLWNRGNWMTINNITVYATNKTAGAGGDGVGLEADNNGGKGLGNVITNVTNGLIFNSAGRGFVASSQNTCTLDHMNYYNNASGNGNTYSSCTHNETTLQPTHMSLSGTDCIVYVPSNSNMHGAGVGGADIGADMRYEHDESGNQTSIPLWDSSTYKFVGCGATVTGLNDDPTGATVATEACGNVQKRLNISAAGCRPIPTPLTFYISPSGSDSNTGTSSGSPWKTFAYAIPRLIPGDTLKLMDGTYSTNAGTGLPNINCSTTAHSGTVSNPITIEAVNERQAFLSADGTINALYMDGCSYWNINGLRGESADNVNTGTGFGIVFQIRNSHYVNLRKLLLAKPNRYEVTNGDALFVGYSDHVLVEDTEAYWFHRWGIDAFSSSYITLRRDYVNSRNYADIPGYATNVPARGEETGFYNTSDSIMENTIVEDSLYIQNFGPRNSILGSIGVGNYYGISTQHHCCNNTVVSEDNVLKNDVAVNNTYSGFMIRSSVDASVDAVTSIGNGVYGFYANNEYDTRNGGTRGTINPSITITNALAQGNTGYGFVIDNATQFTSIVLNYLDAYGNTGGTYGAGTSTKTNATTTDPALGNCIVYVPDASAMKGAGLGGADIGANIVYQLDDSGNPTTTKLWNQSTGVFTGCGVTVTGVNDDTTYPTSSCVNVHKRLNVGQNGCDIP